jgi:TolA-binding protein
MQDIAELERRITAALERIATGLDRVPAAGEPVVEPAGDASDLTAELSRLTTALDEEQMANAQLAERLRVVRGKEAKLRETLQVQIANLMRQLDAQGLELSRAHRTMVQQGGQLRALREAAEAQVTDPALINRTMEVEMEALRATRGAEVAELEDILAALDPLIADPLIADPLIADVSHVPEGGSDART